MKQQLGVNYICDLCGGEFHSSNGNYPQEMSSFKIDFTSSGFDYYTRGDCCKECLPNKFFRDPPSKEPMPKTLFRKLLDSITFKKEPKP